MKNKINELIEQMIPVCESWIQMGDDRLDRFVDPNDNEEISAHYGATHAAASFVIWGKKTENEELYNKGMSLLHSILKRWDTSKRLPAFHYDFNNFALCLVVDYVDAKTKKLIQKTVCNTSDSNHNTINWLPMRWFVNKKRFEWISVSKYIDIINHCRNTIAKATNADGGVEDRLPHGMSFNLQYDLATVAVLQYLRVHGEHLNLDKELGFLLNAVAPDGDINYQGRGTNQIFAWGLWIYLLASSSQSEALQTALSYLTPRLTKMLDNNNLMLNEWDGKEKYLWWDYHYASVYIAHCMLWLILACLDFGKKAITPVFPTSTETGLHIYRTGKAFVSWFEGRREYLAEKGPAVAAIWTKKDGMIFKGTFGPWQGPFGNKYIYEDAIIKNFFGLLEVKRNQDWSKNRYVHKLLPSLVSKTELTFKPLFARITVAETNGILEISFENQSKNEVLFNAPVANQNQKFCLTTDKAQILTVCNETIRNQYDWVWILQSHTFRGKGIKLMFDLC